MKRNILLAFALLTTAGAGAQQVKISESNIAEKENRVTVSFSVKLDKLSSDEKLTLTPVLYSASGTQTLKPIVVVGRNKAISDRRTSESQSLSYKRGERIPYTVTLPYEAWMSEVALRIESKVASCCTERRLASYDVVDPKLIHYDITPAYPSEKIVKEPTELERYDNTAAFLYPMSDYALRHMTTNTLREEGALKIYFKQGSSAIDLNFSSNDDVLAQVNKVIDLIQADPSAKLEKIVILGLTSPEGSLSTNTIVAAKRADALKKVLGQKIKNADKVFEIIPADEDWDGLVKLVKASDMQYKQEVLAIIKQYDVLGGREKHLMDLKGGRPYNYMKEHFFPELRNAGYIQIYYESKPDTTILTLNRAIDQINGKQYNEALETLNPLTDDARVDNLRGVALMMTGDYVQAEICLKKAVKQGSQEAAKNLKEIQTRQRINQLH